MEKYHFILKWL